MPLAVPAAGGRPLLGTDLTRRRCAARVPVDRSEDRLYGQVRRSNAGAADRPQFATRACGVTASGLPSAGHGA